MLWKYGLALVGVIAAATAAVADPRAAGAAAGQVWPAFVLVAGLLLVGLVAAEDGLFAVLGDRLGRLRGGLPVLMMAVTVTVAGVTALLNLDTSVAFLGPILVQTARRRSLAPAGLLAICLLVSNAGSLLLPGSNLTNLIVLGHSASGSAIAARTAVGWALSVVITAMVAAVVFRRGPTVDAPPEGAGTVARRGRIGVLAVVASVVAVLAFGNPAPEVVAIGVLAVAWRVAQGRVGAERVPGTVDLPVLVGLFGLAVGLGALGRAWTGPAHLLLHADPWATAGIGAVASVVVNNLPAAAILSARPPAHPLSLLVGLDIGPNLFVSGSLAWVLWYGAARAAGGKPDVWRTVRAGLIAAPAAGAAAVAGLLLAGAHS